MLIDKLGPATFSNGVLRVACLQIGPDGQERAAGEIMIPGVKIAEVSAQLSTALKRLEREIRSRQTAEAPSDATEATAPETAPAEG